MEISYFAAKVNGKLKSGKSKICKWELKIKQNVYQPMQECTLVLFNTNNKTKLSATQNQMLILCVKGFEGLRKFRKYKVKNYL